jgi:hypothetical protein
MCDSVCERKSRGWGELERVWRGRVWREREGGLKQEGGRVSSERVDHMGIS